MVFGAAKPPRNDLLVVRFESQRCGGSDGGVPGEPMWCTLQPEYLARTPKPTLGRRVRFQKPLSFADGSLVEVGTLATVVGDEKTKGRVVVQINEPGRQTAFMPLDGTFAVALNQKPRTQQDFQLRVAELESLAKLNDEAKLCALNVPLVEQNLFALCGFGCGVGIGIFDRDRASIIANHTRCRVLRPRKTAGLDGTLNGETAFAFDHGALVGDESRVRPYANALRRDAPGRSVLDIGTGPFCLLARLCLQAGAASAEAFEANPKSVDLAVARFRGEMEVPSWMALDGVSEVSDRGDSSTGEPRLRVQLAGANGASAREFRVFQGMSDDTALQVSGGYTLLVHEILGDFAGTEGAAAVIADIHRRGLLAKDCVCIPRRSSTLLAPTSKLELEGTEALVHRMRHGGSLEVKTRTVYSARFFGRKELLAEPQPLEELDFQAGPELEQRRLLEFRTSRDGLFDGVHMHLLVDLGGPDAPEDCIDALALHASSDPADRCSWATTYIRLLEEPIELPAGSRIAVRCTADLSTSLAKYSLEAFVGEGSEERSVSSFEWQGG
eukprot:TRINITY_DN13882_c0_g1_i3.p1 TRINITY_DN13882_c0_g1~~TRINITY_DN13882_c0_g1_i3.p1  ORF type:complete len:555 (+),score=141.25 TRINITY_DN13882_c0_g1_i3:687-2351(+)